VAFDTAFPSEISRVFSGATLQKITWDNRIYDSEFDTRTADYAPQTQADFGQFDAAEKEGYLALAETWLDDGRLAWTQEARARFRSDQSPARQLQRLSPQ